MHRFMAACLLIIMLVISAGLSGCWDLEEIEDLALVANVAFDLGEFKKYRMTVQIVLPENLGAGAGAEGGVGPPIFVTFAEGQTAFEAIQKLQEHLPKRAFFGNTTAVMVGEDLAREGLLPILNLLEKDNEFRRNKDLFLSLGQGGEILEAQPEILANPGKLPIGFARVLPRISTTVPQTIGDFISQSTSATIEPVMPVVKRIEAEPEVGDNPEVRVAKTAVFKRDKLIGTLDEKESRGLLWVLGKIQKGVISFTAANSSEVVSIEVTRAHSAVNAKINDTGELVINIFVRMEGNLADQTGMVNLSDFEVRRSIEASLAETIKDEIRSALNKAQKELKSDVFGFGGAFFRAYPRLWRDTLEKRWDELYPFISVNIDVKAYVRRSNLTLEATEPGGGS